MGKSIIVYITGIDGSGKTTFATMLSRRLNEVGIPTSREWFRFPYLLSIPFLALMKIIKRTVTIKAEGHEFTVHFFENFRNLYKIMFTIDFSLKYLLRIMVRKLIPVVLIVDRGPLDSFVDLLGDITTPPKRSSLLLRFFCNLQRKGIYVGLTADIDVLRKRRIQNRHDPKFKVKFKYYEEIYELCPPHIKINTSTPSSLHSDIGSLAELIRKEFGFLGYGKLFSNVILRGLFSNKYVILFTNWLFQGIFIADITENIVRLIFDLVIPIYVLTLTGNIYYSLAVLLMTHSLNHIFNANSTNLIRYFKNTNHIINFNKIISEILQYNLDGIECIVIFGSHIRGEAGARSDIDLRIVRKGGLVNSIRALLLLYKLRLFSWRNMIPLDAFIHTFDRLCKVINKKELTNIMVIPENKKSDVLETCLEVQSSSA